MDRLWKQFMSFGITPQEIKLDRIRGHNQSLSLCHESPGTCDQSIRLILNYSLTFT